jgi:YbbR domain-containing protein
MEQQEKLSAIKNRSKCKNKTFCKDMLLRFFSLCLGVLIWFLVVGADQVDMNLTIPIEVLNLPKNLVIYNQYQKELNVILRGPRSIMQEMRNRNIFLPVDLSKAEPDTIVIKTEELSLPLPSGISILRIQPANITLSIDKLVQKHIPLTAETEGSVAPGYILKGISLNPDRILVSGPEKLLEQQQSLKTYPLSLNGLRHSSTMPVHLDLSPDFIHLIGETTVVAKITLRERFVEKIIHNIPITIAGAGEHRLMSRPDFISVFASIPEALVMDSPLPTSLFTASVLAQVGKVPHKAEVEVSSLLVPGHENIVIKSYTPQEVEILSLD